MSKRVLLKQFKKDVVNLRDQAKKLDLSETEINDVFQNYYNNVQNQTSSSILDNNKETPKAQNILFTTLKISFFLISCLIFIYILLNVHQTTSSIVLRNVQGLTYPTLRIIRILSVPIIKIFPSLTDLYDESCLIENPYFRVQDTDCWPCENVHSVIDLTQTTFKKTGYGTPFVVKVNQSLITLDKLIEFYHTHAEILNKDSRRVSSSNPNISQLTDFFASDINTSAPDLHIQWNINKMSSARIIRKLFPRPFFISERSGQSVERYVMMDQAKAEPYSLPNTECNFVFVVQGSGQRTVVLKPSSECTNNCRTVSVLLKPSYALWYNWWYWRPISLPTKNSTDFSISYINSYC